MAATRSLSPRSSSPRKHARRGKDADIVHPRVMANNSRLRFPRRLPYPTLPTLDHSRIAKAIPEFKDASLTYIVNFLLSPAVQSGMLGGLATVLPKASLIMPISDIPLEFPCDIAPSRSPSIPPTHVIAVHDGRPQGNALLYPCHALPLLVHCANVPLLPTDQAKEGSLPVISFQLPHPQSFHLIRDYAYTQSNSKLLSCLLPIAETLLPSSAFDPVTLSRTIATSMTPAAVLDMTRQIYGCWANVCALGISDEGIWKCLQLSWKVALAAMVLVAERAHR